MANSRVITHPMSRRQILKGGAALGLGSAAALSLRPSWANPWGQTNVYSKGVEEGPEVSLAIRRESILIDGKEARPISING
ncbi:twin-arginine translocation signal domain-containing protein, partial [Pseudoalteromonas lipolytica]